MWLQLCNQQLVDWFQNLATGDVQYEIDGTPVGLVRE